MLLSAILDKSRLLAAAQPYLCYDKYLMQKKKY